MANDTNSTTSNLALEALATKLGAALKAKAYMLALAESCTGGLVAQAVTSVAGSSTWFDRGFITYSNLAKIEMLSVAEQTLVKFGAVSEETALEMALGALKNSQAQISGSITGIAGPDGGTTDKPVGTVCFAWAEVGNPAQAITAKFSGNRDEIRQQAATAIMTKLIERLNQQ